MALDDATLYTILRHLLNFNYSNSMIIYFNRIIRTKVKSNNLDTLILTYMYVYVENKHFASQIYKHSSN